jgi:hypothetical protein
MVTEYIYRLRRNDSVLGGSLESALKERLRAKKMEQRSEATEEGFFKVASRHVSGRQHRLSVESLVGHKPLAYPVEPMATPDMVDSWINGLEKDAEDEGNPIPTQDVVAAAERIILNLGPYLPVNTDVYTTEDGGIAIEVFGPPGRGFMLVCEPGDSALCIVTVGSVARRARYESLSMLPDGFLREGLQEVVSGLAKGWLR